MILENNGQFSCSLFSWNFFFQCFLVLKGNCWKILIDSDRILKKDIGKNVIYEVIKLNISNSSLYLKRV